MTSNLPAGRENSGPVRLASRGRVAPARWPRRGPDPGPEISEISPTPSPSRSVTARDVAVELLRLATIRVAGLTALAATWQWVSPWVAGSLIVLWLVYRAVTSGRGFRVVSSALARVDRSPRRWSR